MYGSTRLFPGEIAPPSAFSSPDVYLSQPARKMSLPYPSPLEEQDEFALYDIYTNVNYSRDNDDAEKQKFEGGSANTDRWNLTPAFDLSPVPSVTDTSDLISRSHSATPTLHQDPIAYSAAASTGYRQHAINLGLALDVELHNSHQSENYNITHNCWHDDHHKRYSSIGSSTYDSSGCSPLFSPMSMYESLTPASAHSPSFFKFTLPPVKVTTPALVPRVAARVTVASTVSINASPVPSTSSMRFTEITQTIIEQRLNRAASTFSSTVEDSVVQYESPESNSDSPVGRSTASGKRRAKSSMKVGSNATSARVGSTRASVKEGLEFSCTSCGITIAQLNFSGKTEATEIPVVARFTCLDCSPVYDPEAFADARPTCTYLDTVSGVIDQLQGVDEPSIIIPATMNTLKRLKMSKSLQKEAKDSHHLHCDVCRMLVATGQLVPKHPDDRIEFGVETVCGYCRIVYSRCSDCGGGGGPRLGVGKWRCKQLFPDGRRTCTLSHLRLGALDEMKYDCWRISDLPAGDVDELVKHCEEVHTAAMLTALATPDALEAVGALVGTHGQVEKIVNDSWALFEPLIREDIESTTGRRRYIGLRWSTPIPRKKAKLNRAAAAKREEAESEPAVLLRPGKKIVGFVLAELDLNEGSLCLPCIMPSGSVGDTFEATTNLLQLIAADARKDIASENSTRIETGLRAYPDLHEAWTMTMFLKDPRGNNHLEARRGFQPLDKYSAQTGETDMSRFMFDRPGSFVPPELAGGWHILARRIEVDDDWTTGTKTVGSNKRKASGSSAPAPSNKKARKSGKAV